MTIITHPSHFTNTLHTFIQGATCPQSLQPLLLRTHIGERSWWNKMQSPSLWLDPGPHLLLILFLSILYLKFPTSSSIASGGLDSCWWWVIQTFIPWGPSTCSDAVLNLGLLNKSVHGYSGAKKHWDVPAWLTWVPYMFLCYVKKPFILLLV